MCSPITTSLYNKSTPSKKKRRFPIIQKFQNACSPTISTAEQPEGDPKKRWKEALQSSTYSPKKKKNIGGERRCRATFPGPRYLKAPIADCRIIIAFLFLLLFISRLFLMARGGRWLHIFIDLLFLLFLFFFNVFVLFGRLSGKSV